jgi:signal peptidase I
MPESHSSNEDLAHPARTPRLRRKRECSSSVPSLSFQDSPASLLQLASENRNETFVERRSGAGGISGERRTSDARAVSEALQDRGQVALRVYGTSMLPWLRAGDVLQVQAASQGSVRCGDIVLFRHCAHFVVHRIIEKHGPFHKAQYLAKGDANPDSDRLLGQEEIFGRVLRIYRGNRLIDLDSPGQLMLGLLIAQFSRRSRLSYMLPRLASGVVRPARRVLHALAPSSALPR